MTIFNSQKIEQIKWDTFLQKDSFQQGLRKQLDHDLLLLWNLFHPMFADHKDYFSEAWGIWKCDKKVVQLFDLLKWI